MSPSANPTAFPALGALEIAVLEHIWQTGATSAKEAHADIGTARGISVNTVQSTLERLYRKGLLTRIKDGHAFRYAAQVSREKLVAGLISDLLGRFGGDSATSMAAFAEVATSLDETALTALEAELRKRREK